MQWDEAITYQESRTPPETRYIVSLLKISRLASLQAGVHTTIDR
jgi:hypothetical protein